MEVERKTAEELTAAARENAKAALVKAQREEDAAALLFEAAKARTVVARTTLVTMETPGSGKMMADLFKAMAKAYETEA